MQQEENFARKFLDEEQIQTLNSLLYLLLPPSDDGKMPSASDVGFLSYAHHKALFPSLTGGLRRINEKSLDQFGQCFSKLGNSDQFQLIEKLKRELFEFFHLLKSQIINCYYQNSCVLEAIGLDARPPFPSGNSLEQGDLTLLEPVYNRGRIYRA